jgi:UDPglucose 6-dehydrogenase
MTTVGWVGLGKLGLTCALTLEHHAGVDVVGYDPRPEVHEILSGVRPPDNREAGIEELIGASHLVLGNDIDFVVDATDGIVFLAVQTPHLPSYGGEKPMPPTRADFDYSYLIKAAEAVSEAAVRLDKDITLVVISTVLPGTMRAQVMPVLSDRVTLVYNPFFIAMGTTVRDFLTPEFILIGVDEPEDATDLADLYRRLHGTGSGVPRIQAMSIESAELTKVAYNTFISLKIVFTNTLMEICEQIPKADVDEVTGALGNATDRIVSRKYLTAGMGDGGACHPRDNIAMSWLARARGLSTDPFQYVTHAREDQSRWLARIVDHHASGRFDKPQRPIVLLGKSYKPESDLTYGSPALLLAHQLAERGLAFEHWDSHVDTDGALPLDQTIGLASPDVVWVICTKHPEYAGLEFQKGSTVIDPFRYIPHRDGVEVVSLGARTE